MMKIEVKNGVANIYTPYNPDFVKKIKGIGNAKWDCSDKCWQVPETAVDAVREIMLEIYGYSDISTNETISLKVTFNETVEQRRGDVTLFGKVLSHAYGRDGGVKVGDDVFYLKGEAASDGSQKNWYSIVRAGSVVVLTNVNKTLYDNTEIKNNITVEVIENKINKQELLEEKERLEKRIAEINKLLKEEM